MARHGSVRKYPRNRSCQRSVTENVASDQEQIQGPWDGRHMAYKVAFRGGSQQTLAQRGLIHGSNTTQVN